MESDTNSIKATANAHMRRDVEAGSKWACGCEACTLFRSLVGLEKVLDVRPLVRAIEDLGERIDGLPPGHERQELLSQYLGLHDRLADVMAG